MITLASIIKEKKMSTAQILLMLQCINVNSYSKGKMLILGVRWKSEMRRETAGAFRFFVGVERILGKPSLSVVYSAERGKEFATDGNEESIGYHA